VSAAELPALWLGTVGIRYYGNTYRAQVVKANRTTLDVVFETNHDRKWRTVRLGKHWTPSASQLDTIARRIGCFDSYFELLNSAGNYRPTIYPETFKGNEVFARALCCAYDRDQANQNDPRRVFPERDYWDLAPGRRT
jgi:hypothetical protein